MPRKHGAESKPLDGARDRESFDKLRTLSNAEGHVERPVGWIIHLYVNNPGRRVEALASIDREVV